MRFAMMPKVRTWMVMSGGAGGEHARRMDSHSLASSSTVSIRQSCRDTYRNIFLELMTLGSFYMAVVLIESVRACFEQPCAVQTRSASYCSIRIAMRLHHFCFDGQRGCTRLHLFCTTLCVHGVVAKHRIDSKDIGRLE
jgi:hypothetical protein